MHWTGVAIVVLELIRFVAQTIHLALDIRNGTNHKTADVIRNAIDARDRCRVNETVGDLPLRDDDRRILSAHRDSCVSTACCSLEAVFYKNGEGSQGMGGKFYMEGRNRVPI